MSKQLIRELLKKRRKENNVKQVLMKMYVGYTGIPVLKDHPSLVKV